MTTTDAGELPAPVAYQFGTGTATGVWLGFGAGPVAVVGVGLLASILALTAGTPALLAFIPILTCLSLATARVAGRPLLDWVTPTVGHHRSAATGTSGWAAPFPTVPTKASRHDERLRLPREYGRLRLRDCVDDPSIGLLVDTATRTVTVVFDVAGVDRFPLLAAEDRDALIAGWGQSLAVLADTDDTLVRLQLIERARREPAAALLNGNALSDSGNGDEELRRTVDALATRHESRLAVQWSWARLDDTALATVASRCRTVSHSLLSARLLTRPLSTRELAGDLAAGFRGPQASNASDLTPGPVSRRTAWSHVVTDEICHRSYAVTGWPMTPVTADWLSPLLLAAPAGVTRTVAVHLEVVSPAAAARTARTARAKAALDQRDRVRLGMTTSAAIDRAESSGVAMDAELAAGYRTHRLTGLVTLSGDTVAGLDDAARVVRQAAATARLELRPLHGQHDLALAATLPLCRIRSRGQS
jgi:hypothetical protein